MAAEILPYGVLLPYEVYRGSLRLDGQTVANLELLENRDGGGRAGQNLDSRRRSDSFELKIVDHVIGDPIISYYITESSRRISTYIVLDVDAAVSCSILYTRKALYHLFLVQGEVRPLAI